MKQNKKHTYVSISTTDGKRHSEACGRGRGGVGGSGGERKGKGGEGNSILPERQVQWRRGEGGVQGRGKRHLATAGLNYPQGGGFLVYRSVCVCVCVCKVEASHREG